MAASSSSESVAVEAAAAATVKLMSSDKEVFEVEEAVAEQCGTIKNIMEDAGADSLIPVTNVDSETLSKVLEWCKHHVAGKEAAPEELKKWEEAFVDCHHTVLYHTLMAANYLNVKNLLDRLAQKVADMMKGKHPDEIRTMFNIKNDFEPEEYKKIIEQNSWAFKGFGDDPPAE